MATPAGLVDVGGASDLAGISVDGDTVSIGALTTHSALEHSTDLATACPLLAHVVSVVGETEKQHRGRLGGALARAARRRGGSGHCSAIVCPYHSWTYNLDGELRGAPFMEAWKIEGIRLTEVRLETWEGMIFANLDSEADALAPRLTSLRQRIGGFGMSDMGVVWRFDDEFACNWKVLVENFCESYHVFRVHPETVEPDTPTSSVEVLPDGPGFNHHSMDYLANDNGIEKEHLSCIYPATALAVRHGTSIWLSVLPINASTCQVTGWLAESAREDDFASSIESTKAFLAEDKTIVEDVQKLSLIHI